MEMLIKIVSVQVPDGEVPNGQHPVHIDLKVLGVKPVSLARLDLHAQHRHNFHRLGQPDLMYEAVDGPTVLELDIGS